MKFTELPKHKIKRLLQRALSSVGPERFQNRNDNNLLILMYHRVLPADHPDRRLEQPGMFVSPETFDMHMQILQARFELVKLADWIKRARAGKPLPKFACALTFDDGWRDNYDYAYPILMKYGIPATIFVVSGFVGTRYSFWPNRLARLFGYLVPEEQKKLLRNPAGNWLKKIDPGFFFPAGPGMAGQAQLDRLVEKCKALAEDELLQKLDRLESITKAGNQTGEADMMDWVRLNTMQASGLIDIGSHTCRHRRLLSSLPPAVMRAEIEASKVEIESRLNISVEAFCYPNGDYTDEAVGHVRRNYAFACTTGSGWNTPKSDFFRLKRIGVHEDVSSDRHAFLARLSGLV